MQTRELVDVEVVAEGLAFPEGPVVMPDGAVVCCEILGGRLTRIAPDGARSVLAETGGGPNGAALGPDGALYVCNNGGFLADARVDPGIQRVDPATGKCTYLYKESGGHPLVAPNDLVFEETGNFWFTDFMGGAIHHAAPDGSAVRPVLTEITEPNGIGLSPDGRTLYWAQTNTRQVMRRRLSGPGQLIDTPRYDIRALMREEPVDPFALLVGLPGAMELDSLAVDSSGAVCVGTLIESGITEVAPQGGLDGTTLWKLPAALDDAAVTNIAFGGENLQTAYLTGSISGRLLRCTWPRPGLALAF